MANSIVEAIFENADREPNKLALADDNEELTYKEYCEKIKSFAARLKELGIKKNDRVLIEAKQSVDYLTLIMATNLLGAVFAPIEYRLSEEKAVKLAKRAKVTLIIAEKSFEKCDTPHISYGEFNDIPAKDALTLDYEFPNEEYPSEILFSTGTTGREKGVVISHQNNLALAQNVINAVNMKSDNVEIIPIPLNHSNGLRRYYANMANGSTVILLSSIVNTEKFCGDVERYKATALALVPAALTMLLTLVKDEIARWADCFRYVQISSAPPKEADIKKAMALLPKTRFYNIYGSTESGCATVYEFNFGKNKSHCIGKPTVNARLFLTDENRKPINPKPERVGLLACGGKMTMLGYLNDNGDIDRLSQNFIYTDDEAYFDKDGDIILLGRKDDIINVGGKKVAPEEIEEAALEIESVADCCCVAVCDDLKGQTPKLFVKMKAGVPLDAGFIREELKKTVENYKIPSEIVEIDNIPRSFNGKLLRKELAKFL